MLWSAHCQQLRITLADHQHGRRFEQLRAHRRMHAAHEFAVDVIASGGRALRRFLQSQEPLRLRFVLLLALLELCA